MIERVRDNRRKRSCDAFPLNASRDLRVKSTFREPQPGRPPRTTARHLKRGTPSGVTAPPGARTCQFASPTTMASASRLLQAGEDAAMTFLFGSRMSFRDKNGGVTTKRQKPMIRSRGSGPNTRLSSADVPSPPKITPRSTFATIRLMTGVPDGLSILHRDRSCLTQAGNSGRQKVANRAAEGSALT